MPAAKAEPLAFPSKARYVSVESGDSMSTCEAYFLIFDLLLSTSSFGIVCLMTERLDLYFRLYFVSVRKRAGHLTTRVELSS